VRLSWLPVLTVLVAVFGVTPAWGADPPTLAERAAAIERASTERDGIRVVVGHTSRELGIDVDTLRAQRARTGLGWGDLLIAHHLARQNELSFEQVVAELRAGQTWEDIVRSHGADLVRLTTSIERSQAAIEQHSDDKAPPALGERSSSSPGRGGAAGRGKR